MAFERPLASRAQVARTPGGVSVSIPAPRQLFTLLFLPVWLAGWAFGLISVGGEFLHPSRLESRSGFLLVWLAGWLVGGAWVITVLVWMLAGRETLTLDQGRVALEYRALGLGRRREFDRTRTSHWRVIPQVGGIGMRQAQFQPFGFARTGSLAFDNGARTVYFAAGLDEAEASQLLDRLRREGFLPSLPGAA